MTHSAKIYGKALYDLAKAEKLSSSILDELTVLAAIFRREPGYLRLLTAPSVSKSERCQILDDCFRGKIQPYLLNFMKMLAKKGDMGQFDDCRSAYQALYNRDNGILPVLVTSAVALSEAQAEKLAARLCAITGQKIKLENRIDASILGGIRLDYDGKQLDGTLRHRLRDIQKMLQNCAL